jgi:hypothetical protein
MAGYNIGKPSGGAGSYGAGMMGGGAYGLGGRSQGYAQNMLGGGQTYGMKGASPGGASQNYGMMMAMQTPQGNYAMFALGNGIAGIVTPQGTSLYIPNNAISNNAALGYGAASKMRDANPGKDYARKSTGSIADLLRDDNSSADRPMIGSGQSPYDQISQIIREDGAKSQAKMDGYANDLRYEDNTTSKQPDNYLKNATKPRLASAMPKDKYDTLARKEKAADASDSAAKLPEARSVARLGLPSLEQRLN